MSNTKHACSHGKSGLIRIRKFLKSRTRNPIASIPWEQSCFVRKQTGVPLRNEARGDDYNRNAACSIHQAIGRSFAPAEVQEALKAGEKLG